MQQSEGLRARKQRQTRDAIHRAAVDLAFELGPDAATVAEISARVDISPRTFFNYYPTKEDAFVGLHEGLPSDDELDMLRSGTSDDLIGDILTLMLGVFTPSDETLLEQRRALMAEHPQLIQRQWARMVGVEQRIAGVVAERMRAGGAFTTVSDIDDAARALVVTCNAVLRLSIRKIIADHTSAADIRPQVDESLRILREVLRTLP
ncbi:TetR/AcrR family transcriptional regulator [Microbacterium sp. A93]|uniref:TetR/AcrR family transcriptional regulator n=1 Tax=Microbacterium sp. A93 TaxID=3450716 RepID=UPI003F425397